MSDSVLIIPSKEFDASTHVRYNGQSAACPGGRPRSFGKGRNLGLSGGDGEPLRLSTPLMLTWGVNVREPDQAGGRVKYDLSLQFPNEPNEATDAFLKGVKSLEDKLRSDAVEHSTAWFNKKITSTEQVDMIFNGLLRYPRKEGTQEPDHDRAPSLGVKLDCWDEGFTCELFNAKQEPIFPGGSGQEPPDIITKGSKLACIIRCGGIWFANGNFGVTWKLEQAVVKPRRTIRGACHVAIPLDINDDDDDEGEAAVADNATGVTVDDSDSDDDAAQEPEPEPEPEEQAEPASPKKRGRKPRAKRT